MFSSIAIEIQHIIIIIINIIIIKIIQMNEYHQFVSFVISLSDHANSYNAVCKA